MHIQHWDIVHSVRGTEQELDVVQDFSEAKLCSQCYRYQWKILCKSLSFHTAINRGLFQNDATIK